MKKLIAILTLCAAVFGLTACNRSSGDESASSSALPINTSNTLADANTSYFGIRKPSGDTSNTSSGGFSNIDLSDLVPKNGAMLGDSTPLGEFDIAGVSFDITDDISPNVLCERVGGMFGNWKPALSGSNAYEWNDSESGYCFSGDYFTHAYAPDGIYVEALDANGLVTSWRTMDEDGNPTYDDYTIKGISFNYSGMNNPTLVHFVIGIEVGKSPDYYNDLLGKGYEIEGTVEDAFSHPSTVPYKLSIYKTSTATMVLEFRQYGDDVFDTSLVGQWYNERITLIKN